MNAADPQATTMRAKRGLGNTPMQQRALDMHQNQQQLAEPNPEADSPLATEEEKPRSIMDLVPDEDDDPEAW